MNNRKVPCIQRSWSAPELSTPDQWSGPKSLVISFLKPGLPIFWFMAQCSANQANYHSSQFLTLYLFKKCQLRKKWTTKDPRFNEVYAGLVFVGRAFVIIRRCIVCRLMKRKHCRSGVMFRTEVTSSSSPPCRLKTKNYTASFSLREPNINSEINKLTKDAVCPIQRLFSTL